MQLNRKEHNRLMTQAGALRTEALRLLEDRQGGPLGDGLDDKLSKLRYADGLGRLYPDQLKKWVQDNERLLATARRVLPWANRRHKLRAELEQLSDWLIQEDGGKRLDAEAQDQLGELCFQLDQGLLAALKNFSPDNLSNLDPLENLLKLARTLTGAQAPPS